MAIEREILKAITEANDLRSSTPVGLPLYGRWAPRYHLCPERSNLFRHLNFQELDVLELGAGMGGASRFVAEEARSFTALEGTQPRLDCLRARLSDLRNWTSELGNMQDFNPGPKFDVVCVIGVLEYAELYIEAPSGEAPHSWFLKHAASMLKPGGALVLAIENQFGLKYWAGAPEDHTGHMFDGVAGYSAQKTPRTFGRGSLRDLLVRAGLPEIREFYPFPDYKTPHSMLSREFVALNPKLSAEIAGGALLRERPDEVRFMPETLALESIARAGLLPEFANSFLFVASSQVESATCDVLFKRTEREGAWHYNSGRKAPICTIFELSPVPTVRKQLFSDRWPGSRSEEEVGIQWRPEPPTTVRVEPLVASVLRRHSYFGERLPFGNLLRECLKAGLDRWALPSGELSPEAFDATLVNAVQTETGFDWFDLEWVLREPISKSWYVLRNVLSVWNDSVILAGSGAKTARDLYESLCSALEVRPDLESDLQKESRTQTLIVFGITEAQVCEAIRLRIDAKIKADAFPRNPSDEQVLRSGSGESVETLRELAALRRQNEEYRVQMARRVHRLASSAGVALHKIPGLMAFVRSVAPKKKGGE
ncbi:MAG TPA: class I SAM-dependent methyltransferase [Fimbriimonas sp.]|nr:class I SAM-dependent methyltransferase [Fimbriimonas sp.]